MFYNFRKNKKAFTLVELIVVVAIIAVLGTVVGIAVGSALKKTKMQAVESNSKTIADQIGLYFGGDYKKEDGTEYTNVKAYIDDKLPSLKDGITWNSSFNTKTYASDADSYSGSVVYTKDGYKCTITLKAGGVVSYSSVVKA